MPRIGPPIRDAAAESIAEPSHKCTLAGKAKKLRDRWQRPVAIFDQANDQCSALLVQDLGEGRAAAGEPTMNCAPVAAQMLGHAVQ